MTQSQLEELRRENAKLKAKVQSMENLIDIWQKLIFMKDCQDDQFRNPNTSGDSDYRSN